MKKHLLDATIILVLILLVGIFILSACATADTATVNNHTGGNTEIIGVSQHVVYSTWGSYILDYVEDREHGYACYVLDSGDGGSLFCFPIGK